MAGADRGDMTKVLIEKKACTHWTRQQVSGGEKKLFHLQSIKLSQTNIIPEALLCYKVNVSDNLTHHMLDRHVKKKKNQLHILQWKTFFFSTVKLFAALLISYFFNLYLNLHPKC